MVDYCQITPCTIQLTDDSTKEQVTMTMDASMFEIPCYVAVRNLFGTDPYDLKIRSAGGCDCGFATLGGSWVLQYTNEDGIISLPMQSCARARLSGVQSIPNSTYTKLELATEDYDVNDDFDSAVNYRFVVPVDGKYLIAGLGHIMGLGDGDKLDVCIYVNGALVGAKSAVYAGAVAASMGVSVCDVLDLDANDFIELYVRQDSGGALSAVAAVYANFLAVTKLT